ncbi:putative secreted protein [Candidatus Protofrankia californiensis]|uniref:Putative secreted protein n=1 Tax=Candidatus Protofrankia californiensis TaxID=1839754 RepID=A0A1C3PA19_9ACTN|nr:putative secreted protein [Candidatus Protofrankia californiensis]
MSLAVSILCAASVVGAAVATLPATAAPRLCGRGYAAIGV